MTKSVIEPLENRVLMSAVKIMPLGDSITASTDAAPGHASYRYWLYQDLVDAGYSTDFVGSMTGVNSGTTGAVDGGTPLYSNFDSNHEGHWGYKTADILGLIGGWANATKPDVVMLELGTNDMTQGVPIATAIANLGSIIDSLRAANPNVTVLMAEITPDNLTPATIQQFNAQIPTLASQKNTAQSKVVVVDQWTNYSVTNDTFDGVHPAQSGEQKLANNWFNALKTVLPAPAPPASGTIFVSDMNPTSTINGWGQYEKDMSNGEGNPLDGHQISIGGVKYTKGMGVNASSTLSYALNGEYSTFTADVGVDDEVGGAGSVDFQVVADGTLIYDSGKMVGFQSAKHISVSVSGKQALQLIVTDGGDGNSFDHADWANAQLTFGTAAVGVPVVSVNTVAAVNEGSAYSASGSFTDTSAGPWTATVDYGDGTGVKALTLTGKTFALSHTYADNASYVVTVKVNNGSATGTGTASETVNNVAPTVTAPAAAVMNLGATFSGSGSFTDPGTSDTWTATVDYGDGSGPQALTLAANKTFALSKTYATAGVFTITVKVTDKDNGIGTATTTATVNGTMGTPVTTYLSDLTPTSASNGYGPYEKDMSNGENAAGDGHPITIDGVKYTKGLGVHAPSDLKFNLAGQYDTFSANVGLDDEVAGFGSVDFQVYVDGALAYDSGKLTGIQLPKPVNVTVTGKQTLELVVTDSGDGNNYDHADWGDAKLVKNATAPAAPVVTVNTVAAINEGGLYSASGSFTDSGAGPWTATVDYGDGSGTQTLALTGKTFALSHVYADNSTYTVTVKVNNGSAVGTGTASETVNNVNPTVTAPAAASITAGGTFTGSGSFTDPGTSDTWTATVDYGDGTGAQPLTLAANKTFSLSKTYSTAGAYTITIKVTDKDSGVGTGTTSLTVNPVATAPAVTVTTATAINEGGTYSSSGSFTDAGAGPWTATVDYGDGSGTQALSLTAKTFALSHLYADNGNYTVTVKVSNGLVGTGTASETVNNVNPTVTAPAAATLNVGGTFSGNGSFTDPGTSDTWTATVDYGDGTGGQPLTLAANKTFSLSKTYATAGAYTVTITVTDKDGGIGTATTTATVSSAPAVTITTAAAINEGATYSSGGSFTDSGAGPWTATVDYGDGSGTQTLALTGKTFALSHLYADNGNYTVTVKVNNGTDIGTGTASETVNNVNPTVTAPAAASLNAGGTFTGSGSFTDPGTSDTWTATVDYGDGTGAQALTLAADKSFSLSKTYATAGVYTITIKVTDKDSGVGTGTTTATVSGPPVVTVNSVAAINEGGTYSSSGSFTDVGAGPWTATVDYGDGSGIQTLALTGKTFALSHVYADNSTYTVTVKVNNGSAVGTGTASETVNNVNPTVTAPAAASIAAGGTFTGNGSFADPGTSDTWTATVDYGDGTGAQSLTLAANKTFSLSKTYATAGVYTITIKVTDKDGGIGTGTTTATVSGPPVVTVNSAAAINEGGLYSASGSFTDSGAGPWTATVDYGDGSGVQALTLTGKTFALSHGYADNGNYTVTVKVSNGLVGTGTASETVNNVNPTVTAPAAASITAGGTFTGSGSFTDPGTSDTWTATVDYGDGTGAQPLTLAANKTFSLSKTYSTAGAYTITIKVTDKDSGIGTGTTSLTVNPVAPTSVFLSDLTPISATNGYGPYEKDTSNGEGAAGDGHQISINGVKFTKGLGVHAPSDLKYNLAGQYVTFTASVGLDDEIAGLGHVDFQVLVNGTVAYDSGTLTGVQAAKAVSVNVTGAQTLDLVVNAVGSSNNYDHSDWANAKLTTNTAAPGTPGVTVTPAAATNEGGTYTATGSFTDTTAGPWTATVNYGDGSATQALTLNANKTFSLSHVYADNGNYTVTVAVNNGTATGSGTASQAVNNVAPAVSAGPAVNATAGTAFSSTGSFIDPGTSDTWTATVDYGDGTGAHALTLNANKTFSLGKAYTINGTYTVTVKVTDKDGGIGTGTTTVTVTGGQTQNPVFLSDLTPISASNGYGPYEKDTSNGEGAAGDGHPMTIGGVSFAKGLGVHAPSDLKFNLAGQYTTFTAMVGIDGEVFTFGSVDFQVYLDGVLAYDSGIVKGGQAAKAVSVNVTGKQTLELVVTDAGDGNSYDHADWANAKVS